MARFHSVSCTICGHCSSWTEYLESSFIEHCINHKIEPEISSAFLERLHCTICDNNSAIISNEMNFDNKLAQKDIPHEYIASASSSPSTFPSDTIKSNDHKICPKCLGSSKNGSCSTCFGKGYIEEIDALSGKQLNFEYARIATNSQYRTLDIPKKMINRGIIAAPLSSSQYQTCPICNGDGGLNGGCFRCYGKGYID